MVEAEGLQSLPDDLLVVLGLPPDLVDERIPPQHDHVHDGHAVHLSHLRRDVGDDLRDVHGPHVGRAKLRSARSCLHPITIWLPP